MLNPQYMVTSAIIALGSNLGDPAKNLEEAISAIRRELGPLESRSRFYRTEALIPEGEDSRNFPDYINAVVTVSTERPPEKVLVHLLEIEKQLGRIRGVTEKRWQPRIIDLDLLAVGTAVISSERLTLPHPELHRRDFVLVPLVEVAPEWRHPLLGKTSAELLEEFSMGANKRFVKEKLSKD